MKNLTQDLKRAFQYRIAHLFLSIISICLIIFLPGCSQENDSLLLPGQQLDDATLVANQLKQLHQTRANDYSTVLITTAPSVTFTVEKTAPILVDWGDGNREYDVFTHTYTDNFPAHTICFYDPANSMTKLQITDQQLIFLDVTKNEALIQLHCVINRLTTLDVSKNQNLEELTCGLSKLTELDISKNIKLKKLMTTGTPIVYLNLIGAVDLEELNCANNRLMSLDLSTNLKLKQLQCHSNQLNELDISKNTELIRVKCQINNLKRIKISSPTKLKTLHCTYNQIDSLDVSNCLALEEFYCANNQIAYLKISNQSALIAIDCRNNPFEKVANAVLNFIQGLPDRNGKDQGSIWFSPSINESGCLTTVQTFCTIFNWELKVE